MMLHVHKNDVAREQKKLHANKNDVTREQKKMLHV